ncbi:MAG: histidinol dehydrogenase [Planctomycetota bacterium]
MSPDVTLTSAVRLRRVSAQDVERAAPSPVDREALQVAAGLIDAVRAGGLDALRELAARFDGLAREAPLVHDRAALEAAALTIPADVRALLARTRDRIARFAAAQRRSIVEFETSHDGVRAGQRVVPVERAGCYAPGGRYPLPSSVLMTAVTARAAGVERVVVATPRPSALMLAAAHVAGADMVLAAGGAHAVAALALGVGVPKVDLVVGPGNRFVTAAKQLLFGEVGIDLPAGPSELVLVAEPDADPELAAADLLAQAEHDPDARAILVVVAASASDPDAARFVAAVEAALGRQLASLATAEVARAALAHGCAVIARGLDEALAVVDALAPEHLQLALADPAAFERRVRHAGAVFLGEAAAEVLGDYGAGPNHVLPTGGAARYSGGLSVHTFLRIRTWLAIDDPASARSIAMDAASLARLEGLAAHARAASARHGTRFASRSPAQAPLEPASSGETSNRR